MIYEKDIKHHSFNKWLGIIKYNNKTLYSRLVKNQETIFDTVIENIQRIGVTDYAKAVLFDKNVRGKLI